MCVYKHDMYYTICPIPISPCRILCRLMAKSHDKPDEGAMTRLVRSGFASRVARSALRKTQTLLTYFWAPCGSQKLRVWICMCPVQAEIFNWTSRPKTGQSSSNRTPGSPSVGFLRVSGYPSVTWVINYSLSILMAIPGNFLLPYGYPGLEYLICRIYLIGFSSIILNNSLLFFV